MAHGVAAFAEDRLHPNRIAALDGLRCFAIVGVLLFHYYGRWTPPASPVNFYPYGGLLAGFAPVRYGFYGVNLFFVISGFVISLTLRRCTGFWDFAMRRAARLWPSMALCAGLTFAVLSIRPAASPSRRPISCHR